MRVLVTGGAGFVGSHVIDRLRARGIGVRVYGLRRPPYRDDLDFQQGSILDLETLRIAMKGVDAVYHLAAVADVNDVYQDPSYAESINVRGTVNILEAMRRSGLKRLVYGSTTWVYSGARAEVVDEDTPLTRFDDSALGDLMRLLSEPSVPDPAAFREAGIDAMPVQHLTGQRLALYQRSRTASLLALYQRSRRYFELHRPLGVLCGALGSDEQQIIRQAAAAAAVPFVCFQHGGGRGVVRIESIRLSDLRADIFAGYGPKGCEQLEAFAEEYALPLRAVSIGWERGARIAVRWQRDDRRDWPRPGQDSEAPGRAYRIMYAPTPLVGDLRYGPNHDLQDTAYCLRQLEVIQALRSLSGCTLTVKFSYAEPVLNPVEGILREDFGQPPVQVLREGKLSDVVAFADVVVIDNPSTTLIEAMAAGKPVVYVDLGIFRIFPSARPLLNRLVPRIELGRGWEDQLQRAVMKLLREPKQVASGNAFLGAYASLKFSPENLWTALREAAELAPARAETPRAALRH